MIRKNVRPEGENLSRPTSVYIFRCGATALYALTSDRTGQVLPSNLAGAEGWTLERSVTLRLERADRRYESVRATLAAIGKHGFYLIHAAIYSTPIDELIFGQEKSKRRRLPVVQREGARSPRRSAASRPVP